MSSRKKEDEKPSDDKSEADEIVEEMWSNLMDASFIMADKIKNTHNGSCPGTSTSSSCFSVRKFTDLESMFIFERGNTIEFSECPVQLEQLKLLGYVAENIDMEDRHLSIVDEETSTEETESSHLVTNCETLESSDEYFLPTGVGLKAKPTAEYLRCYNRKSGSTSSSDSEDNTNTRRNKPPKKSSKDTDKRTHSSNVDDCDLFSTGRTIQPETGVSLNIPLSLSKKSVEDELDHQSLIKTIANININGLMSYSVNIDYPGGSTSVSLVENNNMPKIIKAIRSLENSNNINRTLSTDLQGYIRSDTTLPHSESSSKLKHAATHNNKTVYSTDPLKFESHSEIRQGTIVASKEKDYFLRTGNNAQDKVDDTTSDIKINQSKLLANNVLSDDRDLSSNKKTTKGKEQKYPSSTNHIEIPNMFEEKLPIIQSSLASNTTKIDSEKQPGLNFGNSDATKSNMKNNVFVPQIQGPMIEREKYNKPDFCIIKESSTDQIETPETCQVLKVVSSVTKTKRMDINNTYNSRASKDKILVAQKEEVLLTIPTAPLNNTKATREKLEETSNTSEEEISTTKFSSDLLDVKPPTTTDLIQNETEYNAPIIEEKLSVSSSKNIYKSNSPMISNCISIIATPNPSEHAAQIITPPISQNSNQVLVENKLYSASKLGLKESITVTNGENLATTNLVENVISLKNKLGEKPLVILQHTDTIEQFDRDEDVDNRQGYPVKSFKDPLHRIPTFIVVDDKTENKSDAKNKTALKFDDYAKTKSNIPAKETDLKTTNNRVKADNKKTFLSPDSSSTHLNIAEVHAEVSSKNIPASKQKVFPSATSGETQSFTLPKEKIIRMPDNIVPPEKRDEVSNTELSFTVTVARETHSAKESIKEKSDENIDDTKNDSISNSSIFDNNTVNVSNEKPSTAVPIGKNVLQKISKSGEKKSFTVPRETDSLERKLGRRSDISSTSDMNKADPNTKITLKDVPISRKLLLRTESNETEYFMIPTEITSSPVSSTITLEMDNFHTNLPNINKNALPKITDSVETNSIIVPSDTSSHAEKIARSDDTLSTRRTDDKYISSNSDCLNLDNDVVNIRTKVSPKVALVHSNLLPRIIESSETKPVTIQEETDLCKKEILRSYDSLSTGKIDNTNATEFSISDINMTDSITTVLSTSISADNTISPIPINSRESRDTESLKKKVARRSTTSVSYAKPEHSSIPDVRAVDTANKKQIVKTNRVESSLNSRYIKEGLQIVQSGNSEEEELEISFIQQYEITTARYFTNVLDNFNASAGNVYTQNIVDNISTTTSSIITNLNINGNLTEVPRNLLSEPISFNLPVLATTLVQVSDRGEIENPTPLSIATANTNIRSATIETSIVYDPNLEGVTPNILPHNYMMPRNEDGVIPLNTMSLPMNNRPMQRGELNTTSHIYEYEITTAMYSSPNFRSTEDPDLNLGQPTDTFRPFHSMDTITKNTPRSFRR